MSRANCLFCRIADRTQSADIVAEADRLIAFKDIRPQAPTHLLIVPTEHIPSIADVTDTHTVLLGQAIHLANRLARQYQLVPGGYRVVVNCGAGAGQTIWHLHWHLLGGRTMAWPPG